MSNLLLRAPTRKLGVLALTSILCLSSIGAAQLPLGPFGPNSVNWPVAAGGNGHIYEPVAIVGPGNFISFAAANDAALAAGGYLATVPTAAENLFVLSLLNSPVYWNFATQGPWLGGHQKPGSPEPGGGWTWITGEAFTYSTWDVNQPDNGFPPSCGLHENCLQYGGSMNGSWNDQVDYCPSAYGIWPNAYIVEYDVELRCPCTPTGLAAENPPPNNVCAAGAFTLCVARISTGAARLQVFNLPVGTSFGKSLISAVPAFPIGSGPIFGLNLEPSLFIPILLAPYGFGDPLSWFVGDPGFSPEQPFFVPPGTTTPFTGQTWDFVALAVTPGGYVLSNYIQTTWP